jgi:hypothetical protein
MLTGHGHGNGVHNLGDDCATLGIEVAEREGGE